MKVDLICEGGGVKGIGHVGAYKALLKSGFEPQHCAGASAGAIVAACIAAGYTPDELRDIMFAVDFDEFKDGTRWKVGQVYNLRTHRGMYKGDVFEEWITDLLADKGVHTFKDLRHLPEPMDPKYLWRLKVIVSDITNGRMLSFPYDASKYGINPDDMEVGKAVRMSMGIPGFFRPYTLTNGTEAEMIDGGVLSNFPVWCWDSASSPKHPTFGLLLKEDGTNKPHKTKGGFFNINYWIAVFKTMHKAHDRKHIHTDDYMHRTIPIPTGDIETTQFNINYDQKKWLYDNGQLAVYDFLRDWSWEEYLKWANKIRGVTP